MYIYIYIYIYIYNTLYDINILVIIDFKKYIAYLKLE